MACFFSVALAGIYATRPECGCGVPEASGGGGGFLQHHLHYARERGQRTWESSLARRP